MAIIISSNGEKAERVDRTPFDKEDYLQKYIYDNPESIPLYDIKEDIRLLILAREFSTNSGPIDAIGIDQYGELYVVETKLYKNPDKRTVVSQALDYGASLWMHSNNFSDFQNQLQVHTKKVFNLSLSEKIKEFFSVSDEDVEYVYEKMQKNLNEGIFHFVVLMDTLEDRLKDLIVYINQNSQFDIYAVQLEYYKHKEYEIIIPRIFGAEVKKEIGVKSSSGSARKKWTEDMLISEAKLSLPSDQFNAFEKMFKFSKDNASEIRLGTGVTGSFSPIFNIVADKSLFTISTDGRLDLNFHWLDNTISEYMKEEFEKIGFVFPDNPRPGFSIDDWYIKSEEFMKILNMLLK